MTITIRPEGGWWRPIGLVKYRGQVIRETVPACEMTLYFYSLLSPLYIAQRLGRQTWRRWMSSRSSPGRGVEPGAEARP